MVQPGVSSFFQLQLLFTINYFFFDHYVIYGIPYNTLLIEKNA